MALCKDNNLSIQHLEENEIPGAVTTNRMLAWMQNLRTPSDFLNITPNRFNGIDIDLDFNLLAGKILQMIDQLVAEFQSRIEDGKLKTTGGHVYMAYRTYTLGDYAKNLSASDNGKGLMIEIIGDSIAYDFGNLPSGAIVDNTGIVLPLCSVHKDGDTWYVKHMHIGSYVFSMPPAPLINGFDSTAVQSLDHTAGGNLVWTTYRQCNTTQQQ